MVQGKAVENKRINPKPFARDATYADVTGSLCWVLLPLAAWHCNADLGPMPLVWSMHCHAAQRHYPTHNLQTYGSGS